MPISRTGLNSAKGFTLIEMLTVVAVIISITGILSVWFGNFLSSKETYLEAVKISGSWDLARNLSETQGVNYRAFISTAENAFWIAKFNSETLAYELPAQVRKEYLKTRVTVKSLNTPRSFSVADGGMSEDYLTFYPDGSAEAGRVVLQSSKGEVYTVSVAATTGMVRILNYEQ
ncbi:MAG: prepilin-type N-terminal cleavage/methylation domain-containing protein [Candidatus Firestonebacteria bacterium]